MTNSKTFYLFPVFLVLYEFTVYMANDMIMPGMVQVIKDFSVGNSFIPISLTAFLMGGVSLQVFLGPLSDYYGRRKTLLLGTLFFLGTTIFIALSQSAVQFLWGRFFQGMGLCFIMTVGYASVQEMFPERQAIKIISIMATVALFAPLVGPVLGGAYTHFFHWRGIFVFIGISAFIALVGLFLFMPETAYLNLKDGEDKPPINVKNIVNNYIRVLKNKKFLVGAWGFQLSWAPIISWIAISPVILIQNAKLTPIAYGLWQIPIFGLLMLGNIYLQLIIKKWKLKKIILVGSVITVLGLILTGLLPIFKGPSYLNIVWPLSLYSFGVSLSSATFTRLILYSSSVAKGSVSAMLSIVSAFVQVTATYATSIVYQHQSNVAFGLFCMMFGILFIPLIILFFSFSAEQTER